MLQACVEDELRGSYSSVPKDQPQGGIEYSHKKGYNDECNPKSKDMHDHREKGRQCLEKVG